MKGSNSCASHKPQGLSSPGLLLNCFSQPCASILCLQGAACKLAIEVGHPFGIGHHWVAHTSPTVPTVPLMPSLGTQFLASSQ